ncbi:MAG: flavodoxin-dependent (E)-4-hydroxy-3-methylbut-2-enyl-diphosphate synthase [Christensenellales bacterium]|jgi:(E)-4-hydroxy-3-methylbut-2-enyl-diphosphate synthase
MRAKRTRQVSFGGVTIGGGNDVLIQSMTNTDTLDIGSTLEQIERLKKAGCEAVRCAFYNEQCAAAFRELKKSVGIPLIADVHFDPNLAVLAIENGADKVRINPGNLGGDDAVKMVVDCAKQNGAALRIGVNAGSLEKKLAQKYGGPLPAALAESAISSVRFICDLGFYDIIVSIKSSSVPDCVAACRLFSDTCDFPMHIGITEAGTYENALIKSSVGVGALLIDGIGDTIRVSITGDPLDEIGVAKRILQSAGLRTFYPEVISCPTCARTKINVAGLTHEVEKILTQIDKPITAAVMGCIVNGPGEARHADIGIAGGVGKAALFAKGNLVGTYSEGEILGVFKEYVQNHF